MFCFPVATWIGNAAAVLGGRWGAVSHRAHEVGCSREAVYQQSRRVEQAVAREQSRGPRYDEVCAENQRLRAFTRRRNTAFYQQLIETSLQWLAVIPGSFDLPHRCASTRCSAEC